MAIDAGLSSAAITVHVKMADELGAPISSAKVALVERQRLLAWKSCSSCIGQAFFSPRRTIDSSVCHGQLVGIQSEYYHRSGERQCAVFK